MECTYTISVDVTGCYRCEVTAESEEEALEKALEFSKEDLSGVLDETELFPEVEVVDHIDYGLDPYDVWLDKVLVKGVERRCYA